MSKKRSETSKIANHLLYCDTNINNLLKPTVCQIWALNTGGAQQSEITKILIDFFNVSEKDAKKISSSVIKNGSAPCCVMPKNCAETKFHIAIKAGITSGDGYEILIKYCAPHSL